MEESISLSDLKPNIKIQNLIHWGPSDTQTPPISRPPASPKSASGLPGNIDLSKDISIFSGRPEADLRAAGGRLIGGLGGRSPPQEKDFNLYFWN